MKITSLLNIFVKPKNWAGLIAIMVFSGVFTPGIGRTANAAAPQQEPTPTAPAISDIPPAIQQFSAGGYILGFQKDGFLMAGLDHMLKTTFVDAKAVQPQTDGSQIPKDEKQKAPPLGKVSYPDLWQGVNMTVESDPLGVIKIGYQVAAGGSVDKVRLRFNRMPEITKDGGMLFRFEKNELRLAAPQAWQKVNGARQTLTAAYQLEKSGDVTLDVGKHDPSVTLAVEGELMWNTFLGGIIYESSPNDRFWEMGITIDSSGNLLIAGISGATWGTPLRPYSGNNDVFVAKMDTNGNLLWNTFLGGTQYDMDPNVTIDDNGNLFVMGRSGATWGTPLNPFSDVSNTFIARLDTNGNLIWHTFLAGDAGFIVLDNKENLFVTGNSGVTWGNPLRPFSNDMDVFVAKLDKDGSLLWNTFLGGNGMDIDFEFNFTIDGSGNLFVTGMSFATWGTPVQPYLGGTKNSFIAKLDNNGNLLWSTFVGEIAGTMGSSFVITGISISIDNSGNVFATGLSDVSWGKPVRPYSAMNDIFIAKLNSDGSLLWNTFLGGKKDDFCYHFTIDGSGNLFVVGEDDAGVGNAFIAKLDTNGGILWNTLLGKGRGVDIIVDSSENLLVIGDSVATWGTPLRPFSGGGDAFLAKLDNNGSLLWNTFLGGTEGDYGENMIIDANGNLFVTGSSYSTWGSPLKSFSGNLISPDGFVTKLSGGGLPLFYTITGKVTDSLASPIPGVTVSDGTVNALTDTNGNYTLSGVPQGNHTMTAVKSGYTFTPTFTQPVSVPPNASGKDFNATTVKPMGDVNCDGKSDTMDSLFILKFVAGKFKSSNTCPPATDTIYLPACDVNKETICNLTDALWILKCYAGLQSFCP